MSKLSQFVSVLSEVDKLDLNEKRMLADLLTDELSNSSAPRKYKKSRNSNIVVVSTSGDAANRIASSFSPDLVKSLKNASLGDRVLVVFYKALNNVNISSLLAKNIRDSLKKLGLWPRLSRRRANYFVLDHQLRKLRNLGYIHAQCCNNGRYVYSITEQGVEFVKQNYPEE